MSEIDASLLPSFIVVGAQKAGTSTLDCWLRAYSEIALPKGKETHYFSDEDKYQRGLDWYLKQFPRYNNGQVRGEVAPQYIYSIEAAKRIYQLVPEVKILFLLRHPIDRAYSNYLMSVRQGAETLPFSKALLCEEERLAAGGVFEKNHYGYMARGRYGEQIGYYRELFSDDQIFYALFEDLMDANGSGDKVYSEIVSFIGLNYFISPDRSVRENIASEPRLQLLRNLLYGSSSLKRWLRFLLPSRDFREQFAHMLDKLNQKPSQRDRSNVPQVIIDACIAETREMETVTGLNFDVWHTLTEKYKAIS